MSQTGIIRVDFEALKSAYPTYKTLPKELQAYMDALNKPTPNNPTPHNTPCCVQVSHALNKAGIVIPAKSFRRDNAKIGPYFYLQAVDELEQYLSANFGRGEDIKKNVPEKTGAGANRSSADLIRDMTAHISGKQGILVFRDKHSGFHTELWDKTHILQDGKAVSGGGAVMNEAAIFGQDRVLFWETAPEPAGLVPVPFWLKGWWKVYDGNTYYYYFTEQHVVTYVKVAPTNLSFPPLKLPLNEGAVGISSDTTEVVIDWNPADGGATKETFTRQVFSNTTMNGVSSRYSPLTATKM